MVVGLSQRETSSAVQRRQLDADLATAEPELAHLKGLAARAGPSAAPTLHERFGFVADVATAGVVGALYGYARASALAWYKDVTPSMARKLTAHVARRTAIGVMLLIGLQEAVIYVKRHRREDINHLVDRAKSLGIAVGVPMDSGADASETGDSKYSQEGLPTLIAVDLANIAILGIVNFCFPYVIVPTLLHPLQFIMPPVEPAFPMPGAAKQETAP